MASVIRIRDPQNRAGLWLSSAVEGRPSVEARWLRAAVQLTPPLVLGGACLALVAAIRGIGVYGEGTHIEGWLLHSVLRVRDGQPLYADYQRYPFVIALYTPLYYYLVGLCAHLMQLDAAATLTFGRTLSLAAWLATVAFIFAIGRRCGLSRKAAIIGSGFFGSSSIAYPLADAARPDMLALAWSLAGLWGGLRSLGRGGTVAAGLLLATAFLTKQTQVAGIAALVLVALQSRRWARAGTLGAVWCACVGGASALLQAWSGGLFAPNVLSPNMLPMSVELALRHALPFMPLGAPLGALAWLGWRTVGAGPPARAAVRWYAALAVIVGLFSLAKAGSIHNHLLEATAGLSLLAASGMDWLLPMAAWESRRMDRFRAPGGLTSVVIIVALIALGGDALQPVKALLHSFGESDAPAVARALGQAPGDVLTELDALAALRVGKTPVLADSYGIAVLAAQQRWEPAPLNTLIESQAFSLIVLMTPEGATSVLDGFSWWPPGTRELIDQHYRPVGRIGSRYLYAPAGPEP